ncbi:MULTISPECIES: GGDEF domain-containing protein [unclassified Pseudodesulfovibrio]|uniref:GGDEF domain-containing protein n=1 Tax=unclassified Pseudodesulfovibrio TaxID=2661612 RepID=UPI000FEBDA73|nr:MULTISPECIES: GGDEF domain-containing protein [unclassified Pseudodesulfovibrio]MCJ2165191.1 GGDEF domain-containing protein [Pseudodesulfovibrio sp. S3-i]RWU03360.1 GGDEF domain-containing protein [Pseudodesulfovibrio sp. S3]
MKTNSCKEIDIFAKRLQEAGVANDSDWMAIVLFVRNLLARLSIYSDEKKSEIQREICDQLVTKDFSEEHLDAIIAMLDMYIMQNIGALEMEEALTQEKRTAALLLNEMDEMISTMHGANERQDYRLTTFQKETVEVIKDGTKKSHIVDKVRGMFQEIIEEFREEARVLNAKAEHFRLTADFDPLLTDLHNRRSLEAYLKSVEEEQAETPAPLAMMMIDVDHFKKVNDTYGHQAGDDVLRALARIINAHAIQYEGFAARYGGEELVIVMKGMDLAWATIKAEALRADVEQYDFRVRTNGQLADTSLNFTVSIGVSEWTEGATLGDLVGTADAALYRAKNTGRNRVCSAPE